MRSIPHASILCDGISLRNPFQRYVTKTSACEDAATVGTPVTRRPPYRPGRAVFPPPVPRLHSLPRRVKPCLLEPAGRLAHLIPVRHVRDACPCRATCFRRDLPHVVGLPHLGGLRSIRLPNRIRWAFPVTGLLHLPVPCSPTVRRFQHCSVSGFPLPCLRSCRPYTVVFHGRNVWGLPRSSTPLFLHATACGLRRTSPSSPCRRVRVAFGSVQTLGIRNSLVEAVPALQGARSPLRPPGYAVDASPILFTVSSLTTPPWTQDSLRVGG